MLRLVLHLLPLMVQLNQGCRIRWTRRELLERSLTTKSVKSHRGARTQEGPLLQNPAISGVPGEDYPVHVKVPDKTSFSCDGRTDGGFYGDPSPESRCQVFHRCAGQGNSSGIKLAKSKLGRFLIKINWLFFVNFGWYQLTLNGFACTLWGEICCFL